MPSGKRAAGAYHRTDPSGGCSSPRRNALHSGHPRGGFLSLNNINVHVVRPLCDRKTVQQQAETFALAAWRRRCNLPLGPRANISCTGAAVVLLHKPFWLLTAQPTIKNNGNKLFVFDASTGLGGVSEYWNVVEYIMTLDGNASAKRTGHPEPQLDLSA